MRKSLVCLVVLLMAAQCLMGCQKKWVNTEAWGMSVWADDGEAVSAARLYYESQGTFMSSITRNFSFQVHTASSNNVNSTSPRGSVITGAPESLYYMSDGDYVLVTSRVPENAGPVFRTHQIFADGQTRELMYVGSSEARRSCSGFNVLNNSSKAMAAIPSPDGSVIGTAYIKLLCDGLSLVVEFKDASSGDTIDGPHEYPISAVSISAWDGGSEKSYVAYMHVGWSESDGLMVGFDDVVANAPSDNTPGWYFSPGADPVAFDDMDLECFSPPTTSSRTNGSGEHINADTETGLNVTAGGGGSWDVFGCGN